jgi:hypothetical protein
MAYKIKRPTKKPEQSQRIKRAHVYAMELGLTDEQRYALARMLPGVDPDGPGSWKNLTSEQEHDLLTMIEGGIYLIAMRIQEGWTWLPPEQ